MPAREYQCKVIAIQWLTSSAFSLFFEPSRRFSYEPGQFLSVLVPGGGSDPRAVRRIYSFASSGKKEAYELCVQKVEGGRGSCYLASLKPGDVFQISAPYGDFLFETPTNRNACFIATGTGIAPFKSMALSERLLKHPPQAAMLLFGARTEADILFPGLFENHGLEVVHALSDTPKVGNAFRGRVTDFLKSLPEDWPWQETDFYLCGNGFMVRDVRTYLTNVRHVNPRAVRAEAYFSTHAPEYQKISQIDQRKEAA